MSCLSFLKTFLLQISDYGHQAFFPSLDGMRYVKQIQGEI
jgi:hypothetical protein